MDKLYQVHYLPAVMLITMSVSNLSKIGSLSRVIFNSVQLVCSNQQIWPAASAFIGGISTEKEKLPKTYIQRANYAH